MRGDIEKIRAAHKVLSSFKYELKPVVRGYNDRTLYVNLTENKISEKQVSPQTKEKFTGGRGYNMRLLWDAVSENTKWDSPENEIVIAAGPIGGNTNYAGSGKSIAVTLSPLTGIPIDSNVGGYFGPYLKFSGFDAIELQGKAQKDVIVYIDGDEGKVEIMEAPEEAVDSHVLGEQMIEVFSKDEEDKIHVCSVSAGTGSEHAYIGCLNFSFYDKRRKGVRFKQAGRGGIGTVFRDKKIKAVVARFSRLSSSSNNPADLKKLQKAGLKLHKEIIERDELDCNMRKVGTAHLTEIMNDYDLLPTMNYKFGSHENAKNLASDKLYKNFLSHGKPDGCWYGCTMACAKVVEDFEVRTGPYKGEKVIVDGPEYETVAGCGSNVGIFDMREVLEINFYCDAYGLDTISFGTMSAFIMECWEKGILDEKKTGGLDFSWGNSATVLELLHQISRGEGFGLIAGKGIKCMKDYFEKEFKADRKLMDDIGMEAKGLEYSEYVTKESLAMQGGYGLTNKGPQHDEAWLIFMDMVQNLIPTFEDKAEALHYFPMFRTWFGIQGLCKLPWNDVTPADNAQTSEPAKVPEHVQNYVDIFNAITGRNIDKEELILQSERVYNFQRVFNIRMGKGKRQNDAIPYRSAGPVTEEEYESRKERYDKQLKEKLGLDPEKMNTREKVIEMRKYREDQYEKLTDAVYQRRGWTKDGVPTIEHLKKIGMDLLELTEVVKKHL
ncbi:aldehyde:ferredoxin oxidoreductase [candidate division WOR-3 bacterium]|nr:aldehyde:ferredoxin oxidoreductase [candidate division WOR-3 bacterium]